ncbi:MAG: M14 family zinc carboxypeptidase [candidate division WOR-3 bacterium]
MNNKILLFLFFIFSFTFATEKLVEVRIFKQADILYLSEQGFDIITRKGDFLYILTDEKGIGELMGLGYPIKIVYEDYQKEMEKISLQYPSFQEVLFQLDSLARRFPEITKLETLGYSGSYPIVSMKITDNPLIEEEEPEIKITGCHHGNEKISTAICLYYIKRLLNEYYENPLINYLVNNREIWIIPILNSDGYVRNRRYNNNNVDLNRDYGYMWAGSGNSPSPLSQNETKIMRELSVNNNFSFSYDYHSAASYVNYLWDFHPKDPPDSNYIIYLSQRYADSTYGSSTTRLVPINGYDWYMVRGSSQDYLFGVFGTLSWTIETQQPSSQIQIDSIGMANYRAFIDVLRIMKKGIIGKVIDSITNEPIPALITFYSPKRWHIYNDPFLGDFYKPLPEGEYNMIVYACGYYPKMIENIIVNPDTATEILVKLIPNENPIGFAYRVYYVKRTDTDSLNPTLTTDCLGLPDSLFYSLCFGGEIVLEVDKRKPIRNFSGIDFVVYEGDDGITESYDCYVSLDLINWHYCGRGLGTQGFDLNNTPLDSAYYIKIVDVNSGSNNLPYAGFDLDGVIYYIGEVGIAENNVNKRINNDKFRIFNYLGQNISNRGIKNLKKGVYFIKNREEIRKIVKIRD